MVSFLNGDEGKASLRPSKKIKIDRFFVQTTSDDDVITTDKTSKIFTAVW